MAGSIYGRLFQISTWGESHGKGIGVVIDGCPAGLSLSEEDIQVYLDRRKPGQSQFTTGRKESDMTQIWSGVFEGRTTGTPISILVQNQDQRSRDYGNIMNTYRPGHADYTFDEKYGFRDYRGGGRSSGRETTARVAAGAVAAKILKELGIEVHAYTKAIGPVSVPENEYHPEEIFQKYYDEKILPKTAAVNVAEYIDHFEPWVRAGYEVIHINLGSSLSSAYQNCCIAAEELGHVHVIDSCSLSSGTGLLVRDAGEMIRQGMSADAIADVLRQRTEKCHASFILDTLTFLHAGGRCSSVAALGANVLKLKPCIEVNNADGSMKVGKKYRGSLDKVLVKYVKDQLAAHPDIDPSFIFITHSGIAAEYIHLVKEALKAEKDFAEIHVTTACCTISSHCGPNTLGILFETK